MATAASRRVAEFADETRIINPEKDLLQDLMAGAIPPNTPQHVLRRWFNLEQQMRRPQVFAGIWEPPV